MRRMPENAYEVTCHDGNLSWKLLESNPVLQHAKDHPEILRWPLESADIGSLLLVASYDNYKYYPGFEFWQAKHWPENRITFSELAQRYPCIGLITIGPDTLVLFPTPFDFLGFVSQFAGAFTVAFLHEITKNLTSIINSDKNAIRVLSDDKP
jgi:hypothetical protein